MPRPGFFDGFVLMLTDAQHIAAFFLSNGLISLLSDRHQWEAICADAALIPNAVEEILRYNSPQTSWRRVATQDTELAGYKIPAAPRFSAPSAPLITTRRCSTILKLSTSTARMPAPTLPSAVAFTSALAIAWPSSRRRLPWKS